MSITGACARQISWGIGVLQPPRCPWPHQRRASRRSRPRHGDYFRPRARTRARRRPLSSRVTDFGDWDGGVSPEDASALAGGGWQDAAAARRRWKGAAPERNFSVSGGAFGGGSEEQPGDRPRRSGRRRTPEDAPGGRQDTTAMAWGQRGRRRRQDAGRRPCARRSWALGRVCFVAIWLGRNEWAVVPSHPKWLLELACQARGTPLCCGCRSPLRAVGCVGCVGRMRAQGSSFPLLLSETAPRLCKKLFLAIQTNGVSLFLCPRKI